MYNNSDNAVFDRDLRVSSIECLEGIFNSIKTKEDSPHIIKKALDMGKVIIKNDEGKMVVVDFLSLQDWYSGQIRVSMKEYTIPETGLLIEMNKRSDVEELTSLFSIDKNVDEYYYLNLAYTNNLNCKLINKLFGKYGVAKTGLIVELCILINREVFSKDLINKHLKDIDKEDVIEIGKKILNDCGVKFKAEAIRVDVNERIESNRNKNLDSPIMEGIQALPKLKSSKEISGLNNTFSSDVRLKYLKLMRLLATSKSVKMTLAAYNSMILFMIMETKQSLSIYSQKTVKQERYNKEYANALKIMSSIIEKIFESYLARQDVPIELTKQVAKLRELVE